MSFDDTHSLPIVSSCGDWKWILDGCVLCVTGGPDETRWLHDNAIVHVYVLMMTVWCDNPPDGIRHRRGQQHMEHLTHGRSTEYMCILWHWSPGNHVKSNDYIGECWQSDVRRYVFLRFALHICPSNRLFMWFVHDICLHGMGAGQEFLLLTTSSFTWAATAAAVYCVSVGYVAGTVRRAHCFLPPKCPWFDGDMMMCVIQCTRD